MQIAGSTCAGCGQPIGTMHEAVGCRTCELFAHRGCAPTDACPRCGMGVVSGRALHAAPSRDDPAHDANVGPLFPVAVHKFVLLSAFTFGAYILYWLYQNWRRIENASHEGLSPFWRAGFAPLWVIPLLRRIRDVADAKGLKVTWSPGALGTLSIAIYLGQRLPDPWWLMCGAAFVPLLPAVETSERVNRLADYPEGSNGRYSLANLLVMLCGGALIASSVADVLGRL